jgi:hypothetical protein
MIDQATLKSLLHYSPETGEFRRLFSSRWWKCGDIADSKTKKGYSRVSINGNHYDSHRLAFLYMTGRFPSEQVDHINGVRGDNRWENIRAATPQENQRNAKRRKDNTSGRVGVGRYKVSKKWRAYIRASGKDIHLGSFDCKQDAVEAREKAEKYYGFHPNHGRKQ